MKIVRIEAIDPNTIKWPANMQSASNYAAIPCGKPPAAKPKDILQTGPFKAGEFGWSSGWLRLTYVRE